MADKGNWDNKAFKMASQKCVGIGGRYVCVEQFLVSARERPQMAPNSSTVNFLQIKCLVLGKKMWAMEVEKWMGRMHEQVMEESRAISGWTKVPTLTP